MLGDIGGLQGILTYICEVIMYLIGLLIPHPLGKEMAESLFNMEGKEKPSDGDVERNLKLIKKRRQLSLDGILSSICCRKRGKKKVKIFEYSSEKIQKELDIVNFVRLQKKLRAAIKLLFSSQERFLLDNNKRLLIPY